MIYQPKKGNIMSISDTKQEKYLVWHIEGGLGKNVAATALCQSIKEQYSNRKLIMVVSHPEVFLNNPYIDRAFTFGGFSYFYQEYIDEQEFMIFAHDPYLTSEHIQYKEHLIETWCKLFGIEYNGELPKIYLTDRERKFFSTKFVTDKPIFLIQTNGGGENGLPYSWARDIPFKLAQDIVNKYFGINYKSDYTTFYQTNNHFNIWKHLNDAEKYFNI